MKLSVLTTAVATVGIALVASSANAAVFKDGHGNVGYDSYDECVTAVKNGTAKFYTPYTHEQPQLGRGERSVKKATLADVMIPTSVSANMPLQTRDYSAGACDLGVGHSNGRSGVSGALVGKYVPFSPNMPVNVYLNSRGEPVRITMQQCDNHFSSKFPVPVISERKALPAQLAIDEDVRIEGAEITINRSVSRPAVRRVVRQVGDYEVKEVIAVPSDQLHRVNTEDGTKVVIQKSPNQAVVVGEEADPVILDKAVNGVEQVPVIEIPSVNQRKSTN